MGLKPTEAVNQPPDFFSHESFVFSPIQDDVCPAYFFGQRHLRLDAPKRFRFGHAVPPF
jgi:hypothetical protein